MHRLSGTVASERERGAAMGRISVTKPTISKVAWTVRCFEKLLR